MASPVISIVIPVVNNLRFNRQCIESIKKYANGDYGIVVVDNNSTDGSREYFQELGSQIRLICNGELRSFAQSCEWVTGARVMISRKLLFETEGFCEEYKNGYEDVDLCFRLRELGYKIYYWHKSEIYHYGKARRVDRTTMIKTPGSVTKHRATG